MHEEFSRKYDEFIHEFEVEFVSKVILLLNLATPANIVIDSLFARYTYTSLFQPSNLSQYDGHAGTF